MLKLISKTLGSGDISLSQFTVTAGAFNKVTAAAAHVMSGLSGIDLLTTVQNISGNKVDIRVLRSFVIGSSVDANVSGTKVYIETSGDQVSGAVATVLVQGE